jgi:acetyl-CoA C-acetyltransferase
MVGYPYTKLMNSNAMVEQGAGIIVCSVERARSLGVPPERWVFPWSGAEANDTLFVSNRASLHRSPAIAAAGRAVLDMAGIGIDDVAHVDLYSCFPSAVEVAAAELGLSLERPLTVTGGLSFAGGPWNNYVTHSLATMTRVLREEGTLGLVTANGGFLTKHAIAVLSSEPPTTPGFRWADVQDQADAAGRVEAADGWDGPVVVEAYTVMHDRDGVPENGIAACRTPDGRRTWGTTQDPGILAHMVTHETVGAAGEVRSGTLHLT